MNDKISVIVPIYRTEPYLRRCLDSLVQQTYTNLEIILVNDGSPDRCAEICDEYAAKDNRIRAVHQSNQGVASARNTGVDNATGGWIGFVDSDDWIEKDMFEYLLNLSKRDKSDLAQCALWYEWRTHCDVLWSPDAGQDAIYSRTDESSAKAFGEAWWAVSFQVYNKIYRRELVQGLRFSDEFPIGEDRLFNAQVLQRAKSVSIGTQPKYHYIQRNASTCGAPPTILTLLSERRVCKRLINEFKNNYSEALHRYETELVKSDLVICSKLTRFSVPLAAGVFENVREELRTDFRSVMRNRRLTLGERVKVFLIVHLRSLYACLVLLQHRRKKCEAYNG